MQGHFPARPAPARTSARRRSLLNWCRPFGPTTSFDAVGRPLQQTLHARRLGVVACGVQRVRASSASVGSGQNNASVDIEAGRPSTIR